jgi:probable HAF family extracellular repeat protein
MSGLGPVVNEMMHKARRGNEFMKTRTKPTRWQILSSAAWTLGLAFVPVRALADTVISSDYIDLSGDIHQVHDVSADGAVVVGQLKPYQWGETFVWKEDALTYLDALLTPVIDWEHPIAVSADGSTIVGTMLNGREEAFRLKDGELTGLGVLPGTTTSQASAVSADGSVIVGRSGNEAFRYEDGIMAGLGVADDYLDSWAAGVSADGSVVIGTAANEDRQEAFRCEGDTMTLLGVLPDEWRSSATHLSADGSTIMVLHDSNDGGPFIRWKDGVTDTISQLGGWPWSDGVYGLSGDGSVIVGGEDWSRAFRWENGNKAYLPPIIEGDFEETREEATPRAEHVSLDGSIVSGYLFWPRAEDVIFGGVAPLPTTAVYWSEENDYAVVYLNDLLDQAGIDREGYELRKAIVTADGSTLIAPAENGVSSRLYRIRLDRSPARMWGAYSVEADGTSTDYGWCDTGAFCGLLYLFGEPDPTTGACWTYSPSLDNYLYFCRAPTADESGCWVFLAKPGN